MKLQIGLGSSPIDEECAQLGSENYESAARDECNRFIALLKKKYEEAHNEKLPAGTNLCIKSNSHDFGVYYEVVALAEVTDIEATEAAYWLDANVPATWQD